MYDMYDVILLPACYMQEMKAGTVAPLASGLLSTYKLLQMQLPIIIECLVLSEIGEGNRYGIPIDDDAALWYHTGFGDFEFIDLIDF